MRISTFFGALDGDPKLVETTWENFSVTLGPHDYSVAEKLDCPAFSPAEYPLGARRLAEAVTCLWLFVADVDHLDRDRALATLSGVHQAGLAAVAYSTWSHAADPWRFRVVNPLTRAVLPVEWPRFWAAMNAAYGGVCDPQCVDPSRLYFGPYAPAGTEDQNFYHVFAGVPVDVDRVLASAPPPSPQPALALGKLSRDSLERYAKQLRRKTSSEYLAAMGDALQLVCRGDPFAEPGERDNTIFRLACLLAERFPNADPQSVAVHFAPSLQLMASVAFGCPTPDDVAYKVGRRQEEVRAERAQKQRFEDDVRTCRIREAWGNCRSTPYTPEEIASFGPNAAKRWIVQRGTSYYLFFNGAYRGPFGEADAVNAAVVHLAPASSAGVELHSFNQRGEPVLKTTKQLVDEYGTVAGDVVVDLAAPETRYVEADRVVIEGRPLRPLAPTYHEDVDRWLMVLTWGRPEYYDNLRTWLAVVTKLDHICSALFLTGQHSVGKSLLALGVSRIWTKNGPTTLEAALDTFNDQLVTCPLTFADERLPVDFRGYTKFEEFRNYIQQVERSYRRKFLPNSKLLGATRTIVAAHDRSILKTPQNLRDDDIRGIAQRLFHVPTNSEAARFLANLRPTTFERGWVACDRIAEHCLWLRDNYPHQSQGRFYVQVPDEGLMRVLSTQSGAKGALCQWLVSYLLEPRLFHASAYSNLYVRVKEGRLLANVRGIMSTWDTYVGRNEKCPPTGVLARALAELSVGERPRYEDSKGNRVNYRVVEMENLFAWAEDNGFCDREQLQAALQADTS